MNQWVVGGKNVKSKTQDKGRQIMLFLAVIGLLIAGCDFEYSSRISPETEYQMAKMDALIEQQNQEEAQREAERAERDAEREKERQRENCLMDATSEDRLVLLQINVHDGEIARVSDWKYFHDSSELLEGNASDLDKVTSWKIYDVNTTSRFNIISLEREQEWTSVRNECTLICSEGYQGTESGSMRLIHKAEGSDCQKYREECKNAVVTLAGYAC